VPDAGAQSPKAHEGATLPWVQIPPPPPLTCKNTGLSGRQTGASCSSGLIYWSQLPAACGPPAGISCGCRAWSQVPRTALDGPGRKHTRRRGVHPALKDRITLSDRKFAENARRAAVMVGNQLAEMVARRCAEWVFCTPLHAGDQDRRPGVIVDQDPVSDLPAPGQLGHRRP
jgi:hypothetical protein